MPITECQDNGKPGLKWGEKGKCYTYTPNNEISRNNAKKKVIKQAIAIGEYNMSGLKVSFDFDDTLTTKKGLELLRKELGENNTIYIISARDNKSGMLNLAQRYNIPTSRVYATGSNQNKVDKLKELGIVRHYDNSQEVIDIAKDKEGLTTDVIKV
jgi:phosphoserine phosphatase